MLQLLDFLYRQRIFLLFLLLEGISFWLIISYNYRYNTYFLNSSNRITGEISETFGNIQDFLNLQRANKELAEENLILRSALANQARESRREIETADSALFTLALANVVNASHRKAQNFLTLRLDPSDSIRPGMGVISSKGVVGTVKSVSKHFATVVSLLHPRLLVSGRVERNDALATVQWNGQNPLEAELKYVPRHLELNTGDRVVTSGFDSTYPAGVLIGVVSVSELKRENPFYTARIRLATDFTSVKTVYVIKVKGKTEKKNLEEEVFNE
ncbi:MAG: rod shape-determining protein MreC [Cytophagales bacterium]|nr:rod shape-determining protein MreC [Cytophagales bacterium]